ncbi:uncharacterized protein [Primulina eburnea]|uniref:uncharacterized protein n=1 Tax=Primulina eburnea TaxID=1245227 RepID=UPI003C6C5BA9
MTAQDGDNMPKPETDWTTDEVQSSNYNSKALNAIFTSVDINMFSLITNCTSAKSAWDILQRHCEGSETVRRTRLRILTSKFEMMRMEESETVLDYDRRLWEIANEAFSCGDHISNERLVSKVLRSLPEIFNIKICAIDEAKYTSQMAFEDLISSLRTLEMNMDMQKKDKGKTLTFQTAGESFRCCPRCGHNICKNSVCLKSTNSGNSNADEELEPDDEEMTLESVQKLYEDLFEDWTKRNKLNSTLVKENTDLKAVVAKLEVILFKKDVELGHWYFDSGSSRHMTGSREHLIDYVEQNCGRVTYGGGAKGKVVGKGTLNVEGLSKLHNVLHVEGLNSNLISISQLCDDNLLVKFDKHNCEVFDEANM